MGIKDATLSFCLWVPAFLAPLVQRGVLLMWPFRHLVEVLAPILLAVSLSALHCLIDLHVSFSYFSNYTHFSQKGILTGNELFWYLLFFESFLTFWYDILLWPFTLPLPDSKTAIYTKEFWFLLCKCIKPFNSQGSYGCEEHHFQTHNTVCRQLTIKCVCPLMDKPWPQGFMGFLWPAGQMSSILLLWRQLEAKI